MDPVLWFKITALVPISYLLGSIPWGIIVTRLFSTADIRKEGSGNIGAANVRRVAGSTLGAITLFGDMAKGAFPVWLAATLVSSQTPWGSIYVSLVALVSFLGHLYPAYTGLKGGGKGVATAAGSFFILTPAAAMIAFLVFVMMVCFFNRVSLGSLSSAVTLPVAVWESTHSQILTGCSLIVAILIIFRHSDNIRRLLRGGERRFKEKR